MSALFRGTVSSILISKGRLGLSFCPTDQPREQLAGIHLHPRCFPQVPGDTREARSWEANPRVHLVPAKHRASCHVERKSQKQIP